MKQDKIDKVAALLIQFDVKAQDAYFDWDKVFAAMVRIESSRKGLISKTNYRE